jgi:hypothetical protein
VFYVLNRAIISNILIFFGFFIFLFNFYTNSRCFALNFHRETIDPYFFAHFPKISLAGRFNGFSGPIIDFLQNSLEIHKNFC